MAKGNPFLSVGKIHSCLKSKLTLDNQSTIKLEVVVQKWTQILQLPAAVTNNIKHSSCWEIIFLLSLYSTPTFILENENQSLFFML